MYAEVSATRLVLVRHGEGRVNREGVLGGLKGCTGLTSEGQRQVQRLRARWLAAGVRPDLIVTSPVQRARETAQLLTECAPEGADAIEDCAACEMHLGDADGLTWRQYEDRFGRFDMETEPNRPFAPGAESWNDVLSRVEACLNDLAARHVGRTVVVVTHAGFIVAALLSLLRSSGSSTAQRAYLDPWFTSTTWLERVLHRWTLLSFNDISHLEEHT